MTVCLGEKLSVSIFLVNQIIYRLNYLFNYLSKENIFVFAKKEKYRNLIAYLAINKFLRSNKILAPKLYAHSFDKGLIVESGTYKELTKNKKTLLNKIDEDL